MSYLLQTSLLGIRTVLVGEVPEQLLVVVHAVNPPAQLGFDTEQQLIEETSLWINKYWPFFFHQLEMITSQFRCGDIDFTIATDLNGNI